MVSQNQSLNNLVTIGVPVYNGEVYIKRALESIQLQTYRNFRVVISDNASADGTQNVCKSIVKNDIRFSYIKQSCNKGAIENFKFLINKASSEYFVYLACDDYWEPEFLELNILNLSKNSNAVASISKVDFLKDGKFQLHSSGDHSIKGPTIDRLRQYLSTPTDNSRFYSIFKTEILRNAIRDTPVFHAQDWYIMALTLTKGDHLCLDEVLMYREAADDDKYQKTVLSNNKNFILGKYFPVMPMTFALLKKLSFFDSFRLARSLYNLNIVMHKQFIANYRPNILYTKLMSKYF